jgi:mycothiol synthase
MAEHLGFQRVRVLLQLRRSLFAPLPPVVLPAGVTVRTFQPGLDDEAWLAVNTRAFASHPEQGQWTLRDLRQRMGRIVVRSGWLFSLQRRKSMGIRS